MLRLSIQEPIVINCTIRLSAERLQKLNCAQANPKNKDKDKTTAKPKLKPRAVARIVKDTPESDFILDCFQPGKGSSPASLRFRQAVDQYNSQYGDDIDDADLIHLIKEWCSTHGYNEEQSKVAKKTGGRWDGKSLYVYKLPMQNLFQKNPNGRGTVMDGRVTHGDGIDRLYIKLALEEVGEPINVISYHRDSDASKQRNDTVPPKHNKTHHAKPTPDETNAGEGMLEEQPEKQAARAQYQKRHS